MVYQHRDVSPCALTSLTVNLLWSFLVTTGPSVLLTESKAVLRIKISLAAFVHKHANQNILQFISLMFYAGPLWRFFVFCAGALCFLTQRWLI